MTAAPPSTTGGWSAPSLPAGSVPPRSTARRAARLIWSIVLAFVTASLAVSEAGDFGMGAHIPSWLAVYASWGAFLGFCASVLLVWRHRFPLLVSAVTTGLTIAFPTPPWLALIALAALVAARRGWLRWVMIAATFLAVGVSLSWDLVAPTSYFAGVLGHLHGSGAFRADLRWFTPIAALLLVAPFALFGVWRSMRADGQLERRRTDAANRNVAALHQEVSLERERQALARELHDTLAARLSAISLHAGALELTVDSSNPQAAAAAKAVRESAQMSLDDLRHVVHVLRNPAAPAVAAAMGLHDLGELVTASLGEGSDVRAQLFVSDAASCDPEVSHACYRIVQESISNIRRHAPGAALFLDVRGGPETGIHIRATNWLAASPPTSRGGGNGLPGMAERVGLVGGTFQAGVTDEGSFALVAWLPWQRRQAVAASLNSQA